MQIEIKHEPPYQTNSSKHGDRFCTQWTPQHELKTGNWTTWTTPLKPGVQTNADAPANPEHFRIHVWFITPVEYLMSQYLWSLVQTADRIDIDNLEWGFVEHLAGIAAQHCKHTWVSSRLSEWRPSSSSVVQILKKHTLDLWLSYNLSFRHLKPLNRKKNHDIWLYHYQQHFSSRCAPKYGDIISINLTHIFKRFMKSVEDYTRQWTNRGKELKT